MQTKGEAAERSKAMSLELADLAPLPTKKILVVGRLLLVDLYIHLPKNQSIVHLRRAGEVFTPADEARISPLPEAQLLVPKDQLGTLLRETAAGGFALDGPETQAVANGILETLNPFEREGGAGDPKQLLEEVPRIVEDMLAHLSRMKKSPSADSYLEVLRGVKTSSDPLTTHQRQVSALSVLILLAAGGASSDEVTDLGTAALLHDIGMKRISTELMRRHLAGDQEFRPAEKIVYMQHIDLAADVLRESKVEITRGAARIIQQHHENWDGSGFRGLIAKHIYRPARALRIADEVVALINRPNESLGLGEAVHAIVRRAEAGKKVLFDPEMVAVLTRSRVESEVAAV